MFYEFIDAQTIKQAPKVLKFVRDLSVDYVYNPSENDYRAAGYKALRSEPVPEAPYDHHVEMHYEEGSDVIYQLAEVVEDSTEQKIATRKAELEGTDYKIIKCSEYTLAGLEPPYNVENLHSERQRLRDEINELEGGEQ